MPSSPDGNFLKINNIVINSSKLILMRAYSLMGTLLVFITRGKLFFFIEREGFVRDTKSKWHGTGFWGLGTAE